ncbi:MAG: AAA family ATPase [Victivallaceae bacterium]|nr:AAA family ATPase [Victivallaceae bacterium]
MSKTGLSSGYTFDQLFPLIRSTLDAGISVLLLGAPGIGKSTLAVDLARVMKKTLIDIRLAQKDPAELGGVYFPNRETQTLELFPPAWVKRACAEPCLVFLDEFNAAVTKLHQAAAYQIVLEKRIGEFQFHPGTVVLAAGNREDDNAIVTPLSSALCNRFAHFEMRPDAATWLKWAAANGIHENIMAFVQTYGEEVLFASSDAHSFPTPRSWAMASRVMAQVDDEDLNRAVAACVGLPMADRFCKYLELYRKVNAAKIIAGKEKIDFTKKSEPSFIYAAIFAVAGYLATADVPDKNLDNIVTFISSPGVGPEYQILFLRQLRNRNVKLFDRLKALPEFRELAGKIVNLRASLYLS